MRKGISHWIIIWATRLFDMIQAITRTIATFNICVFGRTVMWSERSRLISPVFLGKSKEVIFPITFSRLSWKDQIWYCFIRFFFLSYTNYTCLYCRNFLKLNGNSLGIKRSFLQEYLRLTCARRQKCTISTNTIIPKHELNLSSKNNFDDFSGTLDL